MSNFYDDVSPIDYSQGDDNSYTPMGDYGSSSYVDGLGFGDADSNTYNQPDLSDLTSGYEGFTTKDVPYVYMTNDPATVAVTAKEIEPVVTGSSYSSPSNDYNPRSTDLMTQMSNYGEPSSVATSAAGSGYDPISNEQGTTAAATGFNNPDSTQGYSATSDANGGQNGGTGGGLLSRVANWFDDPGHDKTTAALMGGVAGLAQAGIASMTESKKIAAQKDAASALAQTQKEAASALAQVTKERDAAKVEADKATAIAAAATAENKANADWLRSEATRLDNIRAQKEAAVVTAQTNKDAATELYNRSEATRLSNAGIAKDTAADLKAAHIDEYKVQNDLLLKSQDNTTANTIKIDNNKNAFTGEQNNLNRANDVLVAQVPRTTNSTSNSTSNSSQTPTYSSVPKFTPGSVLSAVAFRK